MKNYDLVSFRLITAFIHAAYIHFRICSQFSPSFLLDHIELNCWIVYIFFIFLVGALSYVYMDYEVIEKSESERKNKKTSSSLLCEQQKKRYDTRCGLKWKILLFFASLYVDYIVESKSELPGDSRCAKKSMCIRKRKTNARRHVR